jgi:hypothetical protein
LGLEDRQPKYSIDQVIKVVEDATEILRGKVHENNKLLYLMEGINTEKQRGHSPRQNKEAKE